jgi:FkbM family methyltransferase
MIRRIFNGVPLWVRPEMESDLQAATEVLELRTYCSYFDVEQGEHWLDLGANIGAFTAYAAGRGATGMAYEPAVECFRVLQANAQPTWVLVNSAVTDSEDSYLRFSKSANPLNQYRGTVSAAPLSAKYVPAGTVHNVCIKALEENAVLGKQFDGIKMDIEGSEIPILLKGLLPPCNKLAMEWHRRQEGSPEQEDRCREYLQRRFRNVHWVENSEHPEWDPMVYAWGAL